MRDTYLDNVRAQLDYLGERYQPHYKSNVRFYIKPSTAPDSKRPSRLLVVEYDKVPIDHPWRSGVIPREWTRDDVLRLVFSQTPYSHPPWEFGARVHGSLSLRWPFDP